MSSSQAKRDVCMSSQQPQRGDPHFVIASAAWRSMTATAMRASL
jgi:hypothetical protein